MGEVMHEFNWSMVNALGFHLKTFGSKLLVTLCWNLEATVNLSQSVTLFNLYYRHLQLIKHLSSFYKTLQMHFKHFMAKYSKQNNILATLLSCRFLIHHCQRTNFLGSTGICESKFTAD